MSHLGRKTKSRMFEGLTTWSPWFGCNHRCYHDGCWANRKLAHRLGKALDCSACYSFAPHFHPERLKHVPTADCIFVGAHCDLFGWWVPSEAIEQILAVCRAHPKKEWFFETKNPKRYFEFLSKFPKNTVLSTTIETNRTYPVEVRGYTPEPIERFRYICEISSTWIGRVHTLPVHVSIEPILDFDLEVMIRWMRQIEPFKVAVGYDSLKNRLPEPSKEKTLKLIKALEKFTDVERKQL